MVSIYCVFLGRGYAVYTYPALPATLGGAVGVANGLAPRPPGPHSCIFVLRLPVSVTPDVDDVDERRPHDLDERCTSAPHAQHEGAQLEHTQPGHAQQACDRARTCRRQTARAHRAHSTGTQTCAARAHGAKARSARTARARTGRAGDACTHMVHVCHVVCTSEGRGNAAAHRRGATGAQRNGRDQPARSVARRKRGACPRRRHLRPDSPAWAQAQAALKPGLAG
jgi:hypothetical protein